MTLTLVDMTHSALPGVVKTTSINAYRYAYYPEGWRSADDPEWTGAGSEAPTPHVGDNTQHGGGIEIDYAEITANSSALAVTALTMVAVPGLVVTVPALLRPTYLVGQVHLRSSTASSTCSAMLALVGETNLLNARGPSYTTHRATADPVTSTPFHRLPSGYAGGDWQVFVTATASLNVTVVASSIAPSSIRLVAA
jgi:hypothetical protein